MDRREVVLGSGTMEKIWVIPWLLVLVSSILGCVQNKVESNRPVLWATPIQLQGVANLYRVTDYLYRSEQPTAEGMKNLERMGMRTIIDLKVIESDSDVIRGTGLHLEELSVKPWHIEHENVVRVLQIIRKRENGPFLIHCWKGEDRVGVMIAMFRIIEQGWTKDEAIQEMVEGGYGFNRAWINIVRYVKQADVEKIRKQLEK
jgi:protein tyrosine/serine phosphatase